MPRETLPASPPGRHSPLLRAHGIRTRERARSPVPRFFGGNPDIFDEVRTANCRDPMIRGSLIGCVSGVFRVVIRRVTGPRVSEATKRPEDVGLPFAQAVENGCSQF